jgi:hypothetical protein
MCATTVVWGVKTTMGVKDVRPPISVSFHGHSPSNLHLIISDKTQEFADRMHHVLLTKFSSLTRRIHRSPPELSSETDSPSDPDAEWKWSEAEERVDRALKKDGWGEAAMKGVEEGERGQGVRLK